MNTLKMKIEERLGAFWNWLMDRLQAHQEHVLFVLLLLAWFAGPLLAGDDRALVTDGLWQLVLLSLITFLMIVGLSWWLLLRFWSGLGLPGLDHMVGHFKQMKSWYQIGFYLGCFALLLLAASLCLIAVL